MVLLYTSMLFAIFVYRTYQIIFYATIQYPFRSYNTEKKNFHKKNIQKGHSSIVLHISYINQMNEVLDRQGQKPYTRLTSLMLIERNIYLHTGSV